MSKKKKTIEEVLKDEESHIETLAKVFNRWKEIYHNLPSGTVIFCHNFSTLHEVTTSKIRWCNIAMKFNTTNADLFLYFDYLRRNKASNAS